MQSVLPPLYARWISELLDGAPLPEEKRSACMECPMAKGRRPSCEADVQFHASTKCCTYMPDLPNYLVGMILLDESPEFREGRAVFEREGPRRFLVDELGVYRTRERAAIYSLSGEEFGRKDANLCPYYMEGGLCGIWKYRNSRCSTWFCLYDRGSYGAGFWENVYRLLVHIEKSLAIWNMRLIVSGWEGREREYFRECARRVEQLSWKEIVDSCGPEMPGLTGEIRRSYQLLQAAIPERLRKGSWTARPIDGGFRVWAYSLYDTTDLDSPTFQALDLFQGQPVQDALLAIEKEKGITLDASLLRRLIDTWILLPA
jgi:hypothetical protein